MYLISQKYTLDILASYFLHPFQHVISSPTDHLGYAAMANGTVGSIEHEVVWYSAAQIEKYASGVFFHTTSSRRASRATSSHPGMKVVPKPVAQTNQVKLLFTRCCANAHLGNLLNAFKAPFRIWLLQRFEISITRT